MKLSGRASASGQQKKTFVQTRIVVALIIVPKIEILCGIMKNNLTTFNCEICIVRHGRCSISTCATTIGTAKHAHVAKTPPVGLLH
jgi:hypothetical protein